MNIEKSWPASKTELWAIDKILPYDKNPRTHPQAQIDLIATSMRDDGVTAPILVDERGVILYGHGRRLAALQNGFVKYPVLIARGWTEEKKRALRIKDNSLTLMSAWDNALISSEIAQLKVEGYEISLLGFGDSDLVQFTTTPGPDSGTSGLGSLADHFGIVPFSVLNAREGWWQDRKRAWLALGIESEVGRGGNLLKYSDSVALDGKTYQARSKQKPRPADRPGRRPTTGKAKPAEAAAERL